MAKDGQAAQAGVAKQTSEVGAPERGKPVLDARAFSSEVDTGSREENASKQESGQADRAIRDALEDDEVREALDLHRRTKHP
ncbi:hypothetical protein [Bradyrhizobium guangxiense]|uniref:hypothetical protein n=1 Tax=Bradyrhizobium guangxiense TaxID=1325115 RepID=UPI0013E8E956|nr:hypothetical protein [Bradyrhizobium guangxiense]